MRSSEKKCTGFAARRKHPVPGARLLLPAFLLLATPAAALQATGHEFRPTAEQRETTDYCTADDGARASLRFECIAADGCVWPMEKGKLFAEWRSSEGDLVGEPVLVGGGYYKHGVPYACAPDGSLGALLDNDLLHVVDRDGSRGAPASVCDTPSCFGLAGVSARKDGYLATWWSHSTGLHGRFFDDDGHATGSSFLIDAFAADYMSAIAHHLTAEGDTVVAFKLDFARAIRAAIVRHDGSVVPAVTANEFPYLGHPVPLRIHEEAEGRFVLSWENRELQAGWVARRLADDDAAPTTTTSTTTTTLDATTAFLAPLVLGEPEVGSDLYGVKRPDLAADTEGRWFAAWRDGVPEDNGFAGGTRSVLSLDDARQWSPPSVFHSADQRTDRTVAAGRGNGVLIDVFTSEYYETGYSLHVRRSTNGGTDWSEPSPIFESPYGGWEYDASIHHVVLASGADGRWVAAWTEYVNWHAPCSTPDCIDWEDVTIFCGIRYTVSTDDGVTWSEPDTLDTGICWYGADLEVASEGGSDWVVAWSDWRTESIRGVVSTDGGETFSEARELVSDVDPEIWSLTLAANSVGRWLLAWSHYLYDDDTPWPEGEYARVFVSTTDDPAGAWSTPRGVAPWHDVVEGRDLFPHAAANDDGTFGIAWSTHSAASGLDSDIVTAFSDDGGESWSHPHPIDALAGSDAAKDYAPRLISRGSTWAVAWHSSAGGLYDVRFARTRGDCGNGQTDTSEDCDDANLVEGDGCDTTCLLTGCGSAVVTGDEACDDGNADDADACIDCTLAVCGDGYVQAGVEECDDANEVDSDECLNACTLARCGDGVAQAGAEACDDGALSGNNDRCLDVCEPSSCGDGYLRLGKEHCDDGNDINDDGCSRRCRLESDCCFFDREGRRVAASDALKVLRGAVGMDARCPLHDCDVSRDGSVTAMDALWTLRSAVGLFAEGCSLPDRLVLRMTSNEKPGALQVLVEYADAAGHIEAKSNGNADCTILVGSTLQSINWQKEAGFVRIALVSLQGFQGPTDLLSCRWDPVSGPSLHDFRVTVEDASDTNSQPIEPRPVVTLTAE